MPPWLDDDRTYHAAILAASASWSAPDGKIGKPSTDTARDGAPFAQGNPENSLIELNNRDSPGSPADPGRFR
jgi:hypothetical protein